MARGLCLLTQIIPNLYKESHAKSPKLHVCSVTSCGNATSYVNISARRYARTITQKSWTVNEKLLLILIILNSYVYIRASFLAVKLAIS